VVACVKPTGALDPEVSGLKNRNSAKASVVGWILCKVTSRRAQVLRRGGLALLAPLRAFLKKRATTLVIGDLPRTQTTASGDRGHFDYAATAFSRGLRGTEATANQTGESTTPTQPHRWHEDTALRTRRAAEQEAEVRWSPTISTTIPLQDQESLGVLRLWTSPRRTTA